LALRVHYVLVRFPKLSETFVVREMRELERCGWTLAVDTLESRLDEPRDPKLAELRAKVRRVPDEPGWRRLVRAHAPLAARRPRAWMRVALRARREGRFRHFLRAGLVASRAARERTDLLHVHFAYYSAEYARDASELTGIPYSVVCHANDIWSDFNAPHLPRRLAAAAGVATPTDYNAQALRSVVPGVPVRRLSAIVATEPLEAVNREGPVLAVARAVPKKGIDTLVEACALAAREGEPVQAEVLGDGPELIGLGELAAAQRVEDSVVFRGPCGPDEVSEAYARCSAVVVPSRIASDGDRDGLPTVLFEAMGRGLPVIATDVVGIPELVRDGENGVLVPPDDPAALARALLRVRRDPALAERLGRQARRTIEREHFPERASENLRAWLAECAGRATPPASPAGAGRALRS
jgi:glycosyltransferase involved in cell wall biosynthesis